MLTQFPRLCLSPGFVPSTVKSQPSAGLWWAGGPEGQGSSAELPSKDLPCWAVQALPSPSLPQLCQGVTFEQHTRDQSHLHTCRELRGTGSPSKGTRVGALAMWPPAILPSRSAFSSLEWETVQPAGLWEGQGALAEGCCPFCFGAPSGPWPFCARGRQGGGGLGRQRMGLCSFLLPWPGLGKPAGAGLGAGPSTGRVSAWQCQQARARDGGWEQQHLLSRPLTEGLSLLCNSGPATSDAQCPYL